jgi:hypothetical protein
MVGLRTFAPRVLPAFWLVAISWCTTHILAGGTKWATMFLFGLTTARAALLSFERTQQRIWLLAGIKTASFSLSFPMRAGQQPFFERIK